MPIFSHEIIIDLYLFLLRLRKFSLTVFRTRARILVLWSPSSPVGPPLLAISLRDSFRIEFVFLFRFNLHQIGNGTLTVAEFARTNCGLIEAEDVTTLENALATLANTANAEELQVRSRRSFEFNPS